MSGLIGMLILAYPSIAQEETASSNESISIESNKGIMRWKNSTGLTSFNVELRGKIDLTDDDRDIKSMSDDGYLEISKTVFGSKRAVIIESLGGGKLKKEYYEGRTKSSWEPNGRLWLSEILPEVVRTSTLGAESRVNRFFKQGGSRAVLSEIGKLSGDYTKAHYGKLLLAKNIPTAELPNVITTLSNEIKSDYYLSTLLKDNIEKLLITQESGEAFFKATIIISSDYYKSVVLKDAMKKYAASPAQINSILKAASTINSDYYLSVVLTTLLEQKDVSEESLNELIVVSKKIPSDYYRTQVLNKALQKPDISKTALKSMVEAAGSVTSDYYQSTVYTSMAEKTTLDQDIQIQIIRQIGSAMGSDYYASVALSSMLKHQKLSDESFKQLVYAAGKLNSSHYASQVLMDAADGTLSKAQLLDLMKASEDIESDNYRSNVLIDLAPQVKASDASVKDAYRQAAKGIESESYYGRAIRAID